MAVTIYEIAEKAGVSSSTVARVLRGDIKGSYRRSAETVSRIRQIADELGYRTNARARAFSKGRTHSVGLLYTDDAWIFEGVNTTVVNSLVRRFQKVGYHLILTPIDASGSWEEVILGGQIDGCVVFQSLPESVREAVLTAKLPVVLLGDDSDKTCSHVVVDDFSGGFLATKHLAGLGHKRIAFYVHESVKPHCSIRARISGFNQAIADAGLEDGVRLPGPEEEAVEFLIHGEDRPTALVCYSNLEAMLVMHSMWQYGHAVPQELSIVGFNDLAASKYMTPPLTTVGFDAKRIGEYGANLVLEAIEQPADERTPEARVIKPKLIVRGSTGPAPV
jgi:LacI family transcriptional regulator